MAAGLWPICFWLCARLILAFFCGALLLRDVAVVGGGGAGDGGGVSPPGPHIGIPLWVPLWASVWIAVVVHV